MKITRFVRPDLKNLKPYSVSPTLEQISSEIKIPAKKIIKLDTGENPFMEKFRDKNLLTKIKLFPYPDPRCQSLRNKLATYTSYAPQWIMCGNGSDELIDLLIRAFVSSDENIIINPPTFPMYQFFGELSGVKVKKVLRTKDLNINIKELLKNISPKTKIIYIDSPGNPTGIVVSQSEIKKILNKKVLVVVDEAYFEYCQKTVLPLVKKYPNLVVLRTLSKWAGLAGLRIGYLIANPKIIKVLLLIKPPYNVNAAAQMMACSALQRKKKILTELKKITVLRSKFIKELSLFSVLKVYPSQGAYVLLKPKAEAMILSEFLRKNGVLVKLINQPRLKNCLRVNLGRQKEINRLISLLRGFYENQN